MSNTNNNSAVGYVRVSTDIQVREGHSIDAQKRAIFEYCMYKKMDFKRFYKDEGISGKNTKRAELIEMLDNLVPGTTVIVTSISRLSRDIGDTRNIIETIKNKGCSLTILDLNVDTSTAMGDFMMNVMASVSQFERKQTAERVSATLNNMSREGKLITKPRYGYKLIKQCREGEHGDKISKIVEDPEEQEVINKIRNMIISDPKITTAAIVRKLEGEGIKIRKAKKIYHDTVKKIIEANDLRKDTIATQYVSAILTPTQTQMTLVPIKGI